jgi:hypothetical protein
VGAAVQDFGVAVQVGKPQPADAPLLVAPRLAAVVLAASIRAVIVGEAARLQLLVRRLWITVSKSSLPAWSKSFSLATVNSAISATSRSFAYANSSLNARLKPFPKRTESGWARFSASAKADLNEITDATLQP